MRQFKPQGSNAKKKFVLLSCLSCLIGSLWYLNHSDTSDALFVSQQNESKALQTPKPSAPIPGSTGTQSSFNNHTQNTIPAIGSNSEKERQFQHQETLLASVMENFKEMEQVLENIDHPSVQEFMAALPPESQKSLKMAALKQSVSKRLDIVEANPLSPIDLKSLNQDIDKLAENFVMMPQEAQNLKAYLQQRTKS